jgi:hypothetical protein
MDPMADNVNYHAQLKHKHPARIELTQYHQKTHCSTAVSQHVKKCSKLRSCYKQIVINNIIRKNLM